MIKVEEDNEITLKIYNSTHQKVIQLFCCGARSFFRSWACRNLCCWLQVVLGATVVVESTMLTSADGRWINDDFCCYV